MSRELAEDPALDDSVILARLRAVRGFVFDMDGTLVLGDSRNHDLKPLPGAAAFLEKLDARGIPWLVMTNGTARTPADYVETLLEAGLPLAEERMMTPSSVAADYFCREGYRRIMVLGCPGVWRPLQERGLEVVLSTRPEPGQVDAVYIGWYREFGFIDLEVAWKAVSAGASLYTASDVPFFATAQGPAIGTSCAIAAALKPLTGKEAVVLGKPSPEAVKAAARRLGFAPEDIAVVGDDPGLEVPMALAAGALAIYVHSGTGGAAAFEDRPPGARPDLAISGLDELLEIFDRL